MHVGNGGRIIDVILASIPPVIFTSFRKTWDLDDLAGRVTRFVESKGILSDKFKVYTTDTARSARKATVNDTIIDTEGLENLRTLVGLQSGDTHFTHDLQDTAIAGGLVVVNDLLI